VQEKSKAKKKKVGKEEESPSSSTLHGPKKKKEKSFLMESASDDDSVHESEEEEDEEEQEQEEHVENLFQVFFRAYEDNEPLAKDRFVSYFQGKENYTTEGNVVKYFNPATTVQFSLQFVSKQSGEEDKPDEEEANKFGISDNHVVCTLELMKAHIVAFETSMELETFATDLNLAFFNPHQKAPKMDDEDETGEEEKEIEVSAKSFTPFSAYLTFPLQFTSFSTYDFVDSWNLANTATYSETLSEEVESPRLATLEMKTMENCWNWNLNVGAIEDQLAEELKEKIHVPRMRFRPIRSSRRVHVFVQFPIPTTVRVAIPKIDSILLIKNEKKLFFKYGLIEGLLASYEKKKVDQFDIHVLSLADIEKLFGGLTPEELKEAEEVEMQNVLTEELVNRFKSKTKIKEDQLIRKRMLEREEELREKKRLKKERKEQKKQKAKKRNQQKNMKKQMKKKTKLK
jgi:hypothetical protein